MEVNGSINGHKVNDADEKLLIDSAVYEKYTDMIDEIKGSGLYIKFVDGSNSYTKIVTSRLALIIAVAVIDIMAIAFYMLNKIKFGAFRPAGGAAVQKYGERACRRSATPDTGGGLCCRM